MTSKITVFDHNLHPLDELSVAVTPRSWVLNDYGRAEFTISTSDPKCTERNLQYGNLVFIQHIPSKDESGTTNGKLPDWVGMILPPREWELGMLHVTVYSAELILAFRPMPWRTIQGTPRAMFTKMLQYSTEFAPNIVIQPGVLDDITNNFSDDLKVSGYDHIKTLIKNCGMDWDITGQLDTKGNLQLFGNLYNNKGTYTGQTFTTSNSELTNPALTEQGAPANKVVGHSQAQTKRDRHEWTATHQAALDDYGPLGANHTFMGIHDMPSLKLATQARADLSGRPRNILRRNALDLGNTFNFLNTGNTWNLLDTTVGFKKGGGFGVQELVKIKSMDYNDLSNKCPLNIEVI